MGSLSIWHWVVLILAVASPIMGILRGVQNAAPLHAVISAFIPLYGLIYFVVTKPGTDKERKIATNPDK